MLWERSRSAHASRQGLAAFADDGRTLAFDSDRKFVQLLDAASGDAFASFIGPHAQTAHTLRYTTENGFLAIGTANNFVQVWNLSRIREQLRPLGLDWTPESTTSPAPSSTHAKPRSLVGSPGGAIALSLASVSLAAILAVLSLRRHRSLIEDFARTEALSAQRNRELEVAKVELMHSQKMKALGTLAAGIAHDFNNLLSVIRMSNKLIGRATKDKTDVAEEVSNIEEAVQQGKQVVSSMLGYSRERVDDGQPYDVDELVEDTVSLLSKEFLSGVELTLELDRNAPSVRVGRGRLEQILLNLVVNASEAMKGQGKLKISVHPRRSGRNGAFVLRPRPAGQFVELVVTDSGPGIASDVRARIFEPFFTTKTTGAKQGTGLGLSMVYTIAEQEGLGVAVESDSGKGATFRLLIPCAPDAQFPARDTGVK